MVVFEGDDETGYSTYSPDLPGVVAAGAPELGEPPAHHSLVLLDRHGPFLSCRERQRPFRGHVLQTGSEAVPHGADSRRRDWAPIIQEVSRMTKMHARPAASRRATR